MKITIGRIADVIVDLNGVANLVEENDTVEFNADEDLDQIEAAVDRLATSVNETVKAAKEMSED